MRPVRSGGRRRRLSSPALIRAVESHKDQFVRFRALVLLTAFNDARTAELVREIVANPNDRLRTVAYMYYEHHPAPAMLPTLLKALEREESEFVRPALVRALAAQGSDPRVRETLLVEVGRGQDFFRSAVIEALGDYRAAYAVEPLMAIARLDGTAAGGRRHRAWKAERSARHGGARGAAAERPTRQPADDRGGDLPARHQLRSARRRI